MKLNLGGGHNWKQDGWTNLDHSLGHDLRMGLGLNAAFPGAGSIDAVFCSHMLEHLSAGQARRLLFDCFNAMAPGAVLRIVVPDCEKFARAWLDPTASAFFYTRDLKPHFGSPDECFVKMGAAPGDSFKPSEIGHEFFWDRWTLTWLLASVGFKRVELQKFGTSLDQDMSVKATVDDDGMPLSGFDNPRTEGISCYIEAVR